MAGLLALSAAIDGINRAIGRVAAWAILVAILVSTLNAFSRKVFGLSSNGWLELQWYLFGAVFMLCAPWTLMSNEHIRIDIVSSRLSPAARNGVEVFGLVFFLLPFASLTTILSVPFFWISLRNGEVSNSVGGLLIWPAKLLILTGGALLLLQWLSEFIKRIAVMRGAIDNPDVVGSHTAVEQEAERLLALAQDVKP